MGNLFSFIFLTFPSFSIIFFKLKRRSGGWCVHSVELLGQVIGGAPWMWCAISIWTLMAHQHMVHHEYIVVAHHMSGAPLVSIPSIALFLVVKDTASEEMTWPWNAELLRPFYS